MKSMFEYLNGIEITDALTAVHFALRRISHRNSTDVDEKTAQIILLDSESQDTPYGLELGAKIIREIEDVEHKPLKHISDSKSKKYKKALLKIAERLSKQRLDYDLDKGKELLADWLSNPLESENKIYKSEDQALPKTRGIFIDLYETTNVEDIIRTSLRNKLRRYNPEPAAMPFHTRLLGKDRLALYAFIHSLNTNFGTSVFEPVAVALAKSRFADAKAQIKSGEYISEGAEQVINQIMRELTTAEGLPDKGSEIERIREVCQSGEMKKVKPTRVDVYVESYDGTIYLFDIKTAKPNAGGFKEFKRTLLEWIAVVLADTPDVQVNSLIAIPYNPYTPEPYNRWTMRGMLDLQNELKVAEEFWDFLGGEGAYNDLLDIFERVGIELRSEIDEYFSKFNLK